MAEQTDLQQSHSPPPPASFCRMVSWQLSQAQEYDDIKEKERMQRKKKKKEARKKSIEIARQQANDSENEKSTSEEDVDEGSEDEEVYYSAPTSPIISSDSEPESPAALSHDVSNGSRPGKGKRQKKNRRKAKRQAMVEFFQPLCKLIEDKLCLDVQDKTLFSQTMVPSLAEICLRRLQKISLGMCNNS